MKLSTHSNKYNSKKIALIGFLVLTLAVIYFSTAYFTRALWPFKGSSKENSSLLMNGEKINYSGPTQEERKSSQDSKKNSGTTNSTNSPDNKSGQKVAVAVTYSSTHDEIVEVRAFTPSVIEGDGVCHAVFTKGTQTVEATAKAFIDSSTTQCNPIFIDLSKFPEKGSWSLVVSFLSSNASGSSEKIEVKL